MNKLWINLPVKDVKKSKRFYRDIGFRFNPIHEDRDNVIGLIFGEQEFIVMLFPEETFKQYSQNDIANSTKGNEVMLSFSVSSKDDVIEIAESVKKAGGVVFIEPQLYGDMFGAGFLDPDGHRWNVLFMGDNFI